MFLDPPLDPGGAIISNYIVKMTPSLQQGNLIRFEIRRVMIKHFIFQKLKKKEKNCQRDAFMKLIEILGLNFKLARPFFIEL